MKLIRAAATPAALLILAAVVFHDHRLTHPELSQDIPIDGAALGRAYAPKLAQGYAQAWLVAAKAIEEGKSVPEAQTLLQDSWRETRARDFRETVQPAFALVLPEGSEPADATSRARLAELWRGFARGLVRPRPSRNEPNW